ncbi:hypothetical protein AYI69_g1025 [Smittium culicis]|uniref:Uncharacterized protein n=1 Tax=Smittium culicis TaxID=133412 RepID=A0A1R1YRG5_9FUNG|nr:hypothetical protein AYI69_g1025 [Smittium culicis]
MPTLFLSSSDPYFESINENEPHHRYKNGKILTNGGCSIMAICPAISIHKSHRVTSIKCFTFPVCNDRLKDADSNIKDYLNYSLSDDRKITQPELCFMVAGYSDGSIRLYSILLNSKESYNYSNKNSHNLDETLGIHTSSDYSQQLFDSAKKENSDINSSNPKNSIADGEYICRNTLERSRFEYIGESPIKFHSKCILSVSSLVLKDRDSKSNFDTKALVFSSNTAGSIFIWDVTEVIKKYCEALFARNGSCDLSSSLLNNSVSNLKTCQEIDTDYKNISKSNKARQFNAIEFSDPIYIHRRVHQSGINRIDTKIIKSSKSFNSLSDNSRSEGNFVSSGLKFEVLVSGAGEDDSVSFSMFSFALNNIYFPAIENEDISVDNNINSTKLECDLLFSRKIENAHSASVQSVCIVLRNRSANSTCNSIEESVISISTDQSIKEWSLIINNKPPERNILNHTRLDNTPIADNISLSDYRSTNISDDCEIIIAEKVTNSAKTETISMVADPTCLSLSENLFNSNGNNFTLLSVGGVGMEIWQY